MASQSPEPSGSVKDDDVTVKTEDGGPMSNEDYKNMREISERLANWKDATGHNIGGLFQRMLNKRLIPEYFEIIKEPMAFSTIRGKFQKKTYNSYSEWIRDIALISHNAQVFNRPSAPVYSDAVAIREQFKVELQKLVDNNIITAEVATLPDFGEIPPVEDSPPPGPEEEEVDEDDDEDDDDEEDEDSDEDGVRKRRRRGRRSSAAAKREGGKADDKDDPEAHKKRGRPPKVHTPMEARINTVLKGLRKFKNPGGELKILPFEKLPDKTLLPDYYVEIKNPMAMDLIKRKAKRKKYQSVDQALRDLELMFENAKAYNLEDSQVYRDAVDLQKEARILAEQEKKKPDSDFVDEDGRLPLPEILHNGEIWKVGDWVHLQNPNDLTKPIVAQIYRTWQDQEGQKWINACWYYRPEQTVHRYEKHFFENEVVKTGQYRDHHIDEVVDRCFVMFFTRYNKGRPRGFPADKEVYVCEARYNEDKFKLNKIKTWASCVPDEVREKDYEMDLYDAPRKMKKVPSPIKHLLREDAKEDDPLPKPTWGAANAPPIVGAVHRRPREANESPPPEPTPSPPPEPAPEPTRRVVSERPHTSYDGQSDIMARLPQTVRSPASAQHQTQNSYGQQFGPPRPSASPAPVLQHHNSYGSHTSQQTPVPQTPQFATSTSYNQYSNSQTVPSAALAHNANPNPLASYEQYTRTSTGIRPTMPTSSSSTNAYNPPRPVEVYHLSDSANASIPSDIRGQFHRDEYDRVLFFTAPPLDASPIPEDANTLGHSVKYLAAKARERNIDVTMQSKKDHVLDEEENGYVGVNRNKGSEPDNTPDADIKQLKIQALEVLGAQINAGTEHIYKQLYGAEYKAVMNAELQHLAVVQEDERKKSEARERGQRERQDSKRIKLDRTSLF